MHPQVLRSGTDSCPREGILGWQPLVDGQKAHRRRPCNVICVTLLSLFISDLTYWENCAIIALPVGLVLSSSRAII